MNKFTVMIKATELRIGNYILPRTGTEEYVKVTDIDEYGSIGTEAYFFDGAGTTGTTSEIARGIPLTPEWLERFGFEWKKVYLGIDLPARIGLGFHNGDYHKMTIFQDGKEIYFGANHPEYVHQLQNLYFALTGEELTIKEIA